MPAVRSTILQKQADGRAIAGTFVLFADADVLAGIGRRILINDMAGPISWARVKGRSLTGCQFGLYSTRRSLGFACEGQS